MHLRIWTLKYEHQWQQSFQLQRKQIPDEFYTSREMQLKMQQKKPKTRQNKKSTGRPNWSQGTNEEKERRMDQINLMKCQLIAWRDNVHPTGFYSQMRSDKWIWISHWMKYMFSCALCSRAERRPLCKQIKKFNAFGKNQRRRTKQYYCGKSAEKRPK